MLEVRVPLTSLPDLQTSVTYPDSLTALGVVAEFGLPYEAKPYHGHVFRLGDLADLVERYGVPDAPADWQDRPVCRRRLLIGLFLFPLTTWRRLRRPSRSIKTKSPA